MIHDEQDYDGLVRLANGNAVWTGREDVGMMLLKTAIQL
jgi:hypothetical protein